MQGWPIFKQMCACETDQFIAIKKRNHDTKFAESILWESTWDYQHFIWPMGQTVLTPKVIPC